MAGKKDERVRNWTFIVYPDSAPENWRQIIDDEHIPWVESPLHDQDKNPTEEEKKPHWHILLLFDGKKSYEQILDITTSVRGTIPKRVSSSRGLVRYMAHLDNPEKHQYSRSDIIGHGGADVLELLKPTSSYRYEYLEQMITYINVHNVTSFVQFVKFAMSEHRDDWFPLLCDNSAYFINMVIKSNSRDNFSKNAVIGVDRNGEVILKE